MALNGTIQTSGTKGGVGIIEYDNNSKCILYYRDPNSSSNHSVGTDVLFNLRNVTVTVRNADGSSTDKQEEIALIVTVNSNRQEVEEIDIGFDQSGGLVTVLRKNTIGNEDPPRSGVPVNEQFAYRYGKLVQADEQGADQFYYFDREVYPNMVKTTDRPYFMTRSAAFINVDQKLGDSEGNKSIHFFGKDISTLG
ncbi:MAG: hypothetical protein AAF502_25100 [Bacteroidota bacterium]